MNGIDETIFIIAVVGIALFVAALWRFYWVEREHDERERDRKRH